MTRSQRSLTVLVAAAWLCACVRSPHPNLSSSEGSPMHARESSLTNSVAPALDRYRQETVDAQLWARPQLSRRDRCLVTVAALIARNQTPEQEYYIERALDAGVRASEISELITHLAFYAGWGNAAAALPAAKAVFERRDIPASELPPPADASLPLDEAAESQRAASVELSTGPISPGLVMFTRDVLFHDLWLRPALAPRDRSLVTVTALIANGHVAQVPFHLNRAMDHGLTKDEAGELIAHVAFYAGWPTAFSAVPVVKDVFEKRGK
jgi:4-carboxymuconolactone decarboxylase